jgi:predicted RNA binding protein YcfA (HicA-like mRNA interferase family)
MPKLRRLTLRDVIRIFEHFGFSVYSQKGSHIRLERILPDGQRQRLLVAGHGSKDIKIGTLHGIFRKACEFIPEDDLKPYFYTG